MKPGKIVLVGLIALLSVSLITIIIHLATTDFEDHPQCKLQTASELSSSNAQADLHKLTAFRSKNKDVLVKFAGFVEYLDNVVDIKRTSSTLLTPTNSTTTTIRSGDHHTNFTANETAMSNHSTTLLSHNNATKSHLTPISHISSVELKKNYVALHLESVKSETHVDEHDKSKKLTSIILRTSCAKLTFYLAPNYNKQQTNNDNKQQFVISNNKIKLYRYKMDSLECHLEKPLAQQNSSEFLFQTDHHNSNNHYYCPQKMSYNCTRLDDKKTVVANLHINHIELEWNRPKETAKKDQFISDQSSRC